MRAAALQLNSTGDKDRNLEVAERVVREAAAVAPPSWRCPRSGTRSAMPTCSRQRRADRRAHHAAGAGWARELDCWILAGSIVVREPAWSSRNT